jgi:PD-(D/E)XK nuclease superfamily
MSRDEIKDLLAAVGSLRERYQAAWHERASRFNIFDALNVEYKELSHSQFLAFLLNPSQRHDQGDRYLRSFLALLDITVRDGLDRAEVITEHPIAPYGQLDVLIRIPSVLTVCIENKVAARDQDNQISRYLAWLNSLRTGSDIRAVVYLTPQARSPQDPLLGVDVRPLKLLSYAQIADWVESQSFPVRLRTVTEMYVQTCRKIAGVTVKNEYADDIGQLLTTPKQFANALDIARFIDREKPRIIERFWQNVRNLVRAQLVREDMADRWAVDMSPKLVGASWLAIVAARGGVDNITGHPACYAILAGELGSTKCYYGIRRRAKRTPDTANPFDESMSRELTTDLHFISNAWFCGWRYFSDEGIFRGLPDETEWFVQLNADNQLTEMPLAAKVAEDMWALMLRFRGPLEQLNAP